MIDIKQIIILRKDLNMRKGKMVAQGAHASLSAYLNSKSSCFDELISRNWLVSGQKNICVSINSELELLEIYDKAQKLNLPCALIIDSGLTEFHGIETKTAVAIGPWYSEEVDTITKHLILL